MQKQFRSLELKKSLAKGWRNGKSLCRDTDGQAADSGAWIPCGGYRNRRATTESKGKGSILKWNKQQSPSKYQFDILYFCMNLLKVNIRNALQHMDRRVPFLDKKQARKNSIKPPNLQSSAKTSVQMHTHFQRHTCFTTMIQSLILTE